MGRLLPFGSAPKHLIPDKVCSGSLPTILLTALAPGIAGGAILKDGLQEHVCSLTPVARKGPPFREKGGIEWITKQIN
jgi:hypothetical protein